MNGLIHMVVAQYEQASATKGSGRRREGTLVDADGQVNTIQQCPIVAFL